MKLNPSKPQQGSPRKFTCEKKPSKLTVTLASSEKSEKVGKITTSKTQKTKSVSVKHPPIAQ
jgi:hypothetical protein